MDYDVGIVRRRRIISPDECYFAVPPAGVAPTTFNPVGATQALSGGNLVATSSATGQFVSNTTAYSAGKKYCELVYSGVAPNTSNWIFFIQRSTASYPTGYTIAQVSSNWTIDGTITGVGAWASSAPGNGDIVATAVDFVNGKIWVRSVGSPNWNNNASADPVGNVGGADFSADLTGAAWNCGINSGAGGQICTINFGATAYNFGGTTTPPLTGYTNW
jgi:hypothetical protein